MKIRLSLVALSILFVTVILAGCTIPSSSESCMFTASTPLTAYRLPDDTSIVFGVVSSGDAYEVLAQTADGWVGFDPGFAQAGNIGLAHHRWVLLNAVISPSCLASVDLVTLADVQADVDASNQ